VCERISADFSGDLDLSTGDEWPSHRGAEQILATVDSASAEGGPHELFHEFLAQIFDVAFVGTRCDCFRADAFQLVALANVGGNADNACVVPLLEPRYDDRSIKPARVSEGNCSDHGRLNKYSELLNI